ncbi:hypothetical protein QLH52_14470 [Methylomonas sp. OY6]|uniref:DUF1877 family protein n=1 Tax=Methylomonas defluvii TaxID=3045149 RepID=A0ABU4UG88_9GAMM|nr:hypothetical protein [Methylomonas sp. OY6]MDX8128494.1 hypothetical protein [Methylomonas sp. OY6]
MSLISTFWTLDKIKLVELLSKSKPIEKKVGKNPLIPFMKQKTEVVYPWLDFLNENAHEEIAYELSGMVMTDYDLMLSQVAESIFDLAMPESNKLSEYCGGSAAIIDYQIAKNIIENIEEANFAESDVTKFYDEDEKPEDWRFEPKVVMSTGEHIKQWCSKVTPDKLGILVIG